MDVVVLQNRWAFAASDPFGADTSACDARLCLVDSVEPTLPEVPNPQEASFADAGAFGDWGARHAFADSNHWLLRLGCVRGDTSARSSAVRLSRSERARHAILSWRLKRPYLAYCLVCSLVTGFLLFWNISKGIDNNWNLPQWKHHRWEEFMEVGIGVLIVIETILTIRVVGVQAFFSNAWCIFDFVVALLTAVSIAYGLQHLGARGEICEADVPLLLLRFILQPSRVFAALAVTYRASQMQSQLNELRVDFDTLPVAEMQSSSMAAFEVMRDDDDCPDHAGPFGW